MRRGRSYAARGASDNAGLFAKHLWGAFNQLPVALAAPSLFSVYKKPPGIKEALVVDISQSGQSPDTVTVVDEGRRQGSLTLAIVNEPGSPLADAADMVIETMAGPEKAVASTKTFTTQLVAIAMVSVALAWESERRAVLAHLPSVLGKVLALNGVNKDAAERYRYMSECVVLGRGFNYATAYEWSLKLKESAYVVAEPYSSADSSAARWPLHSRVSRCSRSCRAEPSDGTSSIC
jgi:glucosamine--fructose-6-phosphate aminotransferase (isomerizing)